MDAYYPFQPSPGIGRHLFDDIRHLSTYIRCVGTVPASSSNTLLIPLRMNHHVMTSLVGNFTERKAGKIRVDLPHR